MFKNAKEYQDYLGRKSDGYAARARKRKERSRTAVEEGTYSDRIITMDKYGEVTDVEDDFCGGPVEGFKSRNERESYFEYAEDKGV